MMCAAVLVLAGCSGSDAAEEGGACSYDTTVGAVSVAGTIGEQAQIEVAVGAEPAEELVVEDLCQGDGATAQADSTVTVDYVGVALSTGEVFDSSYIRGQPATFGLQQVLQGWQVGLQGMQEGGSRLLVIPADLAYGEASAGPGIGPNETLIFVIDLLEVA